VKWYIGERRYEVLETGGDRCLVGVGPSATYAYVVREDGQVQSRELKSWRIAYSEVVGSSTPECIAIDNRNILVGLQSGNVAVIPIGPGGSLGAPQLRHVGRSPVFSIAVIQPGDVVVSSDEGVTSRWRVDPWECVWRWEGHRGPATAVGVSPDRTVVAAGDTAAVRLLNAADGSLIRSLAAPTGSIRAVAFASDSKFVVGAGDVWSTVEVWSVQSGEVEYELYGHERGVTCLLVEPNAGRTLFSGSYDGSVIEWNTGAIPRWP
jgi:WD40 repeat protein